MSDKTKAAITSTLNSAIAVILFIAAVIALPIPGNVEIDPEWAALLGGLAVALRTLVAYFNPKDPSFGVGSGDNG